MTVLTSSEQRVFTGRRTEASYVVGYVATHNDLLVVTVLHRFDRVLGARRFSTTRRGYRLMLIWMASFSDLQRVGIECSDSDDAGLLRDLPAPDVGILEITAPCKITIAAAARAMALVRKARPLQLMQTAPPSHPAARREWTKVFGFEGVAEKPPFKYAISRYRRC